jgi:hypothetical protein
MISALAEAGMSVDYTSYCIAVPGAMATRLTEALGPFQRCGAIIGPDEATFIEAWRGVRELCRVAVAAEYAGARPSLAYWEGASVELREEHFEWLGDACECVTTHRTSAIAGLDRVLALPLGVEFLDGHAIAHVPRQGVDRVKRGLTRLWKELGGKKRAAALLREYLRGNVNDGAAEAMIRAVESAFDKAAREQLDIVLLSATMP